MENSASPKDMGSGSQPEGNSDALSKKLNKYINKKRNQQGEQPKPNTADKPSSTSASKETDSSEAMKAKLNKAIKKHRSGKEESKESAKESAPKAPSETSSACKVTFTEKLGTSIRILILSDVMRGAPSTIADRGIWIKYGWIPDGKPV